MSTELPTDSETVSVPESIEEAGLFPADSVVFCSQQRLCAPCNDCVLKSNLCGFHTSSRDVADIFDILVIDSCSLPLAQFAAQPDSGSSVLQQRYTRIGSDRGNPKSTVILQ